MATNTGAPYDTATDLISWASGAAGTNALAGAILGKESSSTETAAQTTAQTGTQATTGQTSTASNQASSQTGTQTGTTASTGAQNTTGTTSNAGTQLTAGTNTTAGNTSTSTSGTQQQATTGTIGTTQTSNQSGTQTATSTANLDPLQQVFARQMGGITPDALAAIFSEGAREVPNLVNVQANALGARASGNTPLARVMNDLNVGLTNKAAMMNLQLLSDAGSTAGKIADATKSTTTSNTASDTSVQTQVQDLLQSTNSQQLATQLQNVINTVAQEVKTQETGTQQQAQTSSQNQTQNLATAQQQATTGTQVVDQSQNVATTQNQQTDGTKKVDQVQQQVLNSNLFGKVAAALGSGIGIAQLYSMAKSNGWVGDIGNFLKGLIANGADPKTLNQELAVSGFGELVQGADGNLSWINGSGQNLGTFDVNVGAGFGFDTSGVGSDWQNLFSEEGFADGGLLKPLEVPNLFPSEKPAAEGDSDLAALLSTLGLSSSGSSSSSGTSYGGASASGAASPSASGEGGPGVSAGNSVASNPGAVGNAIGQTVATGMLSLLGVPPVIGRNIMNSIVANNVNAAPISDVNSINSQDVAASQQAALDEGISIDVAQAIADVTAGIDISTGESDVSVSSDGDGDVGVSVGGSDGYANGGAISGPGTGVSDSIPANGPGGRPIKVSAGEFILPADTTAALGVDFLNELVRRTHVPADLQRAMTGA